MTALALQLSLAEIVQEYDAKRREVPEALAAFTKAGEALISAATIQGTYGLTTIETGHANEATLKASLLKSAWQHVYAGLNIDRIASADDKRRFRMELEKPPEFTLDNIRATFGQFVLDPRGNILRGLAEVFSGLDHAFKSHDKVKIGVAGLPKRVIVKNVSEYGSYGKDQITNLLNALAAYQGKPLPTYREISALLKDEEALLHDRELPPTKYEEATKVLGRGVRLRRFRNGNAHLFFEPETLRDINKALAEFYGEVLCDTTDEKPTKKAASTAVSKDLQYYPTPIKVVGSIVDDLYRLEGAKVLEPSAGCGRFMDALRAKGADVFGVEVDPGRAAQCRAKGHSVLLGNFLETVPTPKYDRVVMNPPFYGKHYAKHVEHALKFLKPGGTLTAILPATARYDHGVLDHLIPKSRWGNEPWNDLPVGSFSESGTNINISVLTLSAASAGQPVSRAGEI